MADKTALFPPYMCSVLCSDKVTRHILPLWPKSSLERRIYIGRKKSRTDDKIDLRTESKSKILVAHKLVHFDGLNNTMICDTLYGG